MAATPWSFGAPEGKISRAWPAGWWTVSTSPFRSLLFGADGASAATGPGGTLPDRRVAACRRCPRDTYGGGDAGCASCPPGTTTGPVTGAVAQDECVCEPGFGLGGGGCEPCAAGTFKPRAGSAACAPCDAGTSSGAGALYCE